jgi:cell division protease FtsH
MALGLTQQLPEGDRYTHSLEYITGSIAILMGGRIAEEVFLSRVTTGAANDIERATELARKMVCEFGMSSLGPLTFGKKEEQIFLGREIAQHQDYSEVRQSRLTRRSWIVIDQYEAYHESFSKTGTPRPPGPESARARVTGLIRFTALQPIASRR